MINGFPKPCVFSVGLARCGLAAVQWIAAPAADFLRKACKNLGSGNMRKKKHVKTQGSAPGTLQNLVFYSTFLSVSKTPMEVSRYICSLGAVPGASWTSMSFLCRLYGSQSSDMKTWKKTGFWPCSDAEPCVFTIILISMFPKPCVFSVGLARCALAAG